MTASRADGRDEQPSSLELQQLLLGVSTAPRTPQSSSQLAAQTGSPDQAVRAMDSQDASSISAWAHSNLSLEQCMRLRPWLPWALTYTVGMVYFFGNRVVTLPALSEVFSDQVNGSQTGSKVRGVVVGMLEDAVWMTYVIWVLWLIDSLIQVIRKERERRPMERSIVLGIYVWFHADAEASVRRNAILIGFVRWLLALLVLLAALVPFAADVVLMRTRQMRFTFVFLQTYFHEKSAAASVEFAPREIAIMHETVGVTAAVIVVWSIVSAVWLDFSLWNPTRWIPSAIAPNASGDSIAQAKAGHSDQETTMGDDSSSRSHYRCMEEGETVVVPARASHSNVADPDLIPTIQSPAKALSDEPSAPISSRRQWITVVAKLAVVVLLLIVIPEIVRAIACAVPYFVSSIALNTSLNEPFRLWFHAEFLPGTGTGALQSASYYIHEPTENCTLFSDSMLFRRTHGFHGPLAFDVEVDPTNPPNVLVLVVESFRYHDSQYLVGNNTYLLKDQNITVTPNFDRWAKRGIAFRNLWSSWRTSRSVESILYSQLPYDSVSDSGMTGGRSDVKLYGMPQFFKQKGYEPIFTTGCRVDYDQWDKFIPTHGFDELLSKEDIKELAEQDLGIKPGDWSTATEARAMSYWGVHDDVALAVLGNIMINKTNEQKARVAKKQPKKPFFINHYTISSHTPFEDKPKWYAKAEKPDFSPLYEGETHASEIKRYLEMRYFTDMAIGKLMDRMEKEGILNDTIVVIVGDHGQGPENGLDVPESRQVSATRVAATLIAEGRLGKYAGLMVDDAAEQYDFFNTLADIVGVPEDGFLQTGVGRSLKRVADKSRTVWSNNPSRKMAVIRGHHRIEYAKVANA